MSYQSRVKKRRHKRIERQARRAPEAARRWFLMMAKKPGKCTRCGAGFDRGAEIVYRHEPRETRCVRCASRLEDSKGYRPSIRWERKQRVAQ